MTEQTFSKKMKRDLAAEAVKMPPHSMEAEQSVLGALMLDNQGWDKISHILDEQDFYRQEHRVIFRAISHLLEKSQAVDIITLQATLTERKELEKAGGENYLFELARNTLSVANISAYADIVHERSVLRQLIGVASDIADIAFNPEGRPSTELLDEAERKVFQIAEQKTRGSGPTHIKSIITPTINRIDSLYKSKNPITGIATGFHDFDEMTSGLQKADLVIIAGRPSMGKTILGINFAEQVGIKEKKPVLIFSMEMPSEAIAMRLISSLGCINQHALRTGKLQDNDWNRVTHATNLLSESSLFIDDTPALTPSEIRTRTRRIIREHGDLALIVIDYLQLMQMPSQKENRATEMSEISRSLKSLAKEFNVPVVALSQLNRSLEQRPNKRPVMSDIRESGAIEQDADVIVFIYRDEVYNPDSPMKNEAEIIIAKQRNGPIGSLKLTFRGEYTRFDNYADTRIIGHYQ